ncbi:MAG: Gfo/Idh/MocA family oxidoreductase [Bryobacterales bacterium]|nr:Gfo/Idh/MocA family oxidoreductase [Bryobacterales bacterium]
MQLLLSRRSWIAGAAGQASVVPETLRLPRRIRLAMVGLDGHTGEVLGPLRRLPDVELAAICDPNPAARASAARNAKAPQARQYDDYRRMLDRETLDMAAICGPNGGRAAAIVACAERKLHVVAEKPLALTRQELDQVKRAVSANGIRLTMLLPMRFDSGYMAMKKVVESGRIGEVAQMGAQKSYKVGERPAWMRRRATFGGTIPFIGIHMVDLMRYTSGRELVETVSFQNRIGYPELAEMENTTGTMFRMDNGGVALLRMDYLRPETAPTHGDDRLRLAGTRGILEYQQATGLTLLTQERKPEIISELPPRQSLFLDFLASVYHGQTPGLSLTDIYRANEIVLAARESAEQRTIVKT